MKTYTIDQLRDTEHSAATLEFSTAGADVLTLSGLTPEWVHRLGWTQWERIIVTDDAGVVIFSGLVTQGQEMAAQGGTDAASSLTAESDWSLLDSTAYVNVDEDGVPKLLQSLRGDTPTASLASVLSTVFNAAAGWPGSRVGCTLDCNLAGQTIPMNSTGADSCAGLMRAALEWEPDAVIRMGYADSDPQTGAGLRLRIEDSMSLAPVTISADEPHSITRGAEQIGTCDGLSDISLRPRPDLVLPAAAIIGAQHYTIGGDAREPGAFIYCCARRANEDGKAPTGADDGKGKTVILGLDLPPRSTLTGAIGKLQPVDQVTHELLARCYPILAEIGQGNYHASGCRVSLSGPNTTRPKQNPHPGRLTDPDANDEPANYDTAFVSEPDRPHVHIEGSFPASARASRNISGLKWCRASLRLIVAVNKADVASIPATLHDAAREFFKGQRKEDGTAWNFAELTISCNLINSEYRAVKGTKPLSTDLEYIPPNATDAEPNLAALLTEYYNASQTLCHEGSLTLQAPSVRPEDIIGHRIRVTGLAPEWAGMTAICRAASLDISTGAMTLSLGTRDVLGFDQRIERARISRRREENLDLTAHLIDTADPDQVEAEEEVLMVSPDIGATIVANSTGELHPPFKCYTDSDGKWTMQGGSFWIGTEEVVIATTSQTVTAGRGTGTALAPKLGTVHRRVYQTSKNGKLAWTYDIYQQHRTTS